MFGKSYFEGFWIFRVLSGTHLGSDNTRNPKYHKTRSNRYLRRVRIGLDFFLSDQVRFKYSGSVYLPNAKILYLFVVLFRLDYLNHLMFEFFDVKKKIFFGYVYFSHKAKHMRTYSIILILIITFFWLKGCKNMHLNIFILRVFLIYIKIWAQLVTLMNKRMEK